MPLPGQFAHFERSFQLPLLAVAQLGGSEPRGCLKNGHARRVLLLIAGIVGEIAEVIRGEGVDVDERDRCKRGVCQGKLMVTVNAKPYSP